MDWKFQPPTDVQTHNRDPNCGEKSPWSHWYQPGSSNDDQIYDNALQKCKEVNEQLNSQPWWDDQCDLVASSKTVESMPVRLKPPGRYDASWVQNLIAKERLRINTRKTSESAWRHKVSGFADDVIRVATLIKPIVDIFVPQSPECSVPYACLWMVFKGVSSRKEKKELVFGLITSLSDEIPTLQAYGDMFPTDEMKETLSQFYIHTVDLLWRLAKYYSIGFFKQLTDAILPRTKYDFPTYLDNIKKSTTRLKALCELGHMAEQKDIKGYLDVLHSEIRHLRLQIEMSRGIQGRRYASDLIDIWHDDVGDVEHEHQLWQSLRFSTDMRDHWSQNGILPCLADWREHCDTSENSILWVSSQSNGRQSWLTEFTIDVVSVCRSQGQDIMIAMCDRPNGVKWTPAQLLRQLIAQLLIDHPELTVLRPGIFNARSFRRATKFDALYRLLNSVVAVLKSVLIIIDRLDLCVADPNEKDDDITRALSILARAYPNLRVIVTTGEIVSPSMLPGFPVSFAMVNTRRHPRRRRSPSPEPPPKRPPVGRRQSSYA
ncbi:uncharacterized protein BO88DRAFT_374348 [Aspergillus vadensis CBS 113365]|uniref:Uncharacterized protein n=1 Tax=Aspergillus vadensis (strain CBS 113365 / IMI 142717 / IBT 24658) TaxID=1448311 RepID=A0A319C6J0_ASPVC|nr:hypothetical protein BO88DRAFT_374348 [Aspergillus vadensis CBS 113365]PYH64452.1 hypothetical protein BO88DRAFT_374348 [Aspergillus vadensis CBS 113365]